MTSTDSPALTPSAALWTSASFALSACGAGALAHAWFPRGRFAGARRVWRSHFRPVDPMEFAAGAALGIGAFALGLQVAPGAVRTRGGWLFDDRIRRAVRVNDPEARARVANLSDLLLGTCVAAPFVQATVVTAIAKRDLAAAAQSLLIAAESLGLTYAVMWGFKTFFGRERPCVRAMREEREHVHVVNLGPARGSDSFISGHAAFAFAGAALVCVQAGRFKLYRRGVARALCSATLATAAVTATARVVADRHYATDILAGALLGLFAGFVLPSALYLRKKRWKWLYPVG